MDWPSLLRAVFALAVTLGLVGLAAWGARRWAPASLFAAAAAGRTPPRRRLQLVESLSLSPSQRLVLVRVDAGERLILLGEGRLYDPASVSSGAEQP